MTPLIFDVDGTLVDSYGLDEALYKQAVEDVLGDVPIRPDWGDYEHVTDAGILSGILFDAGLTPTEEIERGVRARFGELVTEALQSRPGAAIAGAAEMLGALKEDRSVAVGIATGGWDHTARAKLHSAGFALNGLTLRSSSDHAERQSIMLSCLAALNAPGARPVYFGDGGWDVEACRALNWAFVGIGARLEGRCAVWLPDFSACDLAPVIAAAEAACHGDWARA